MEMEMKANKNIGKYERYEDDDGFYKELERRIDELIDIDNTEEVKPCKFESSTLLVGKNTMVLDGRKYYDWSVSGSSRGGRPVFSYYPSTSNFSGTGTGTGVFIPPIAHKFERWAASK